MGQEVTIPSGISPVLWDAILTQMQLASESNADTIRRLVRIETKLCKLMAASNLDGQGQPVVVSNL